MTYMLNDPTLEALLERLHAQSCAQSRELDEHFSLLSRTNRKQPLVDTGAKTFLADKLVAPHLRTGAIVVCDNTADARNDYRDYFEFIRAPDNGFRTMTLPFDGGFEFSVKCG